MDYFRGLWRNHRRKVFVTAGCLGSGYLLYKLYTSHTRKLADLERELAYDREHEETIKTQMKVHFENIQKIVESSTLPHAVHYLSVRMSEEIDVSYVMERLNRGKGMLSSSEKLQLWDELKILSFTRMVLSLWSVTMLSLYIRVQVNILGRHLYVDTARALGSSHLFQEELEVIDSDDEQKFLSSADYLVAKAMPGLISNMLGAVRKVLKEKQLKDVITTKVVQETVLQIIDVFMSTGSPHQWIDYLMVPQDIEFSREIISGSSQSDEPMSKFHQLMVETREVLISTEFMNIVEISLKHFTDMLVEEMEIVAEGLATGMPLAKVLPQIEKIVPAIIAEPDKNRFLQHIRDLSEVEFFFTLLYANGPQ